MIVIVILWVIKFMIVLFVGNVVFELIKNLCWYFGM